MTEAHEVLEQIKARAAAATPGPWEWEGKQDVSFPQSENSLIVQGDPEREVLGSWGYDAWGINVENPADAEFITSAREDVPRLVTALDAVLALHPRSRNKRWVGFPRADKQEAYCVADEEAWPCATVQEIRKALGG